MRLRIRELREDKDIKQEVIAKYLNVTQETYARYESGNINIPIENLIKISKYHNTSLDYITYLSDNPNFK